MKQGCILNPESPPPVTLGTFFFFFKWANRHFTRQSRTLKSTLTTPAAPINFVLFGAFLTAGDYILHRCLRRTIYWDAQIFKEGDEVAGGGSLWITFKSSFQLNTSPSACADTNREQTASFAGNNNRGPFWRWAVDDFRSRSTKSE